MKQPHILCSPEQITPYVLLPGDPARTERIAKFLTGVEYIADNREFRTVTGLYEGLPVTVTSTGIGGASLAIALEELIQCGGRYFIRTGSCGACQEGIGIGDLVLSTAAVREDGASRMYVPDNFPAGAASRLTAAAETVLKASGFPFHVVENRVGSSVNALRSG